ncbi:MAG: AtpZ/AtpI family protein [Salibacteraceae bacterium]|nr:AtpZ/AtpI family protein [Salibacteraceae bacterium]MDP4935218.1 AtpZ/AtpI family protein [Salibacteraceae bacterium]
MPKNQRNKILELSGMGIQMGVTIFLGAYFGKWLDGEYPADKKWFTMIFTLLAVGASLYSVIKQVNKLND